MRSQHFRLSFKIVHIGSEVHLQLDVNNFKVNQPELRCFSHFHFHTTFTDVAVLLVNFIKQSTLDKLISDVA